MEGERNIYVFYLEQFNMQMNPTKSITQLHANIHSRAKYSLFSHLRVILIDSYTAYTNRECARVKYSPPLMLTNYAGKQLAQIVNVFKSRCFH